MHPEQGTQPSRILIVDDQAAIHEDFRKILASPKERRTALAEAEQILFGEAMGQPARMSYTLDFALQGQEALELVRRSFEEDRPYALAFMDIRMPPGWDGIETMARIWEIDPDLQGVLCTAYSDYALDDIVKVLGDTDNLLILKKPFDMIEVMQLASTLTKKWMLTRHMRMQVVNLDRLVHQRTQALQETNQRLEREAAERAQAEQALASEKQLLDVTLQSISDGVVATDLSGRILFMNQAAQTITGWAEADAWGRPLGEVLPARYPEPAGGPRNLVETVLKAGNRVEFPYPLMLGQREGTPKRLTINGAPLADARERIIGVVFTFRDTTMWHLLETERFKANKLESIGVLAGGIAHDFNNILTAILGNLSAIRLSDVLSERQLQYLTIAENATRRAELLTKQLLTFAKGGAPILKPASIRELIQESADFVLSGSNVKCVYDFPDDLWTVHIDEGQMSQVVSNLVINAQQAMPRGGTITVRGENVPAWTEGLPPQLTKRDYVKIDIIDTGVGIPREYLSNIFDPYFTTKDKGSGLGLTSAYSIIKNHTGYLSVESEPDAGSTFFFYLPALPHEAVESKTERRVPIRGQGRILVMDDEKDIRKLCQDLLVYLGYEVECVLDGTAAVERYREAITAGRPFDAVVLDLTVQGGMGGGEAMEQLKAIDPHIKAIVSSGYSDDPVMSSYATYGFSGIIQKPFDVISLSEILHRIIKG
jgi:PAS domain S-box-containing protein